MDAAAKTAADAVFNSNYPLIVMAAIFLAFIGFCVHIILKRQAELKADGQRRDDLLGSKVVEAIRESDKKWESSTKAQAEANRENARVVEIMGNHFIELLQTTVGAMNSLGESVRKATEQSAQTAKESAANIARLEQAIEKKQDKKST